MKLTGTYNGKPIELELTEEQVEVLKQAEKKKTGWERVELVEDYYFIDYFDEIEGTSDDKSKFDDKRFNCANYFSDETLAKNIARAQTLQRKLWRRSAELCGKLDLNNVNVIKWYIYYDFARKDMCIGTTKRLCDFGQEYFDTEEHAKQVMEEFRDELIWYFTKFQSRMD